MATLVRDYVPADAEAVAALFNRHRDVPNPIDGGITAGELAQELQDRDTHTFLVAVDTSEQQDRLIGTFGLFRSDGRRVAGPGELIADMFFVAPAHRGGMLTAELFGEAVERMVHSPYSVLRLTVNPANGPAYTLYRRVGCLAVHRTVPGADGNVQLHNFLPLVLRQVLPALPAELLDAVVAQRTTSFIPRALPSDMEHDVTVLDGRRVVQVPFAIGDVEIDTVIDIDNRVVLRADLPGFSYRPEAHLVPPPVAADAAGPEPTVVRGGELALHASADGTVEVWRDGHLGPVWIALWPTAGRGRVTGWRAGNPRAVQVVHRGDAALQLTEQIDETTLTATVSVDGTGFTQRFSVTGAEIGALRAYHLVGLRTGRLSIDGHETPLGDGLGVRDAGQLPAAQRVVDEGTQLRWTTPGSAAVTVRTPTSFGVISSTVTEQRDIRDGSVLRVEVAPAEVETKDTGDTDHADAPATSCKAAQPGTLRLAAEVGGIVGWKPFGRNVFRAPYPRTRSFANNARWSAGLWVGSEFDRYDRCYGPGWGAAPPTDWTATGDELRSEQLRLRITEHTDTATAALVVEVDAGTDHPESALWLTPDVAPSGHVTCFSPYDDQVDRHELKQRWQRWTPAVCVPLRGDRTLTICGDPESATAPELLVRCTDAGLLIAGFARTGGEPVRWNLHVTDREIDSFARLPRHTTDRTAA